MREVAHHFLVFFRKLVLLEDFEMGVPGFELPPAANLNEGV